MIASGVLTASIDPNIADWKFRCATDSQVAFRPDYAKNQKRPAVKQDASKAALPQNCPNYS
jgi:hypothetical protein